MSTGLSSILVVASQESVRPAVDRALLVAARSKAKIDVIAFVYDAAADRHSLLDARARAQLKTRLLAHRRGELETELAAIGALKRVSIRVEWHKHYHEWLCANIDALGADLVIKNAHYNKRPFLLPSDWYLMRKLPRPLWLVNPVADKFSPRLAMALDAGSELPAQQALDAVICEQAGQLAKVLAAPLDAIYVEPVPKVLFELDLVEKRRYRVEAKQRADQLLQDAIKRYGAQKAVSVRYGLFGDPERELVRIARKNRYSLVVLGTTARAGLKEWLIGNTSERIAAKLATDVLVIKAR